MLLLSLCIVSVIQLTSSQSTHDVTQQNNNVSSCGATVQVLSQLSTGDAEMRTAMSQLVTQLLSQTHTTNSRLVTSVSQIQTAMSQLQSDVAHLKAVNQQPGKTPESS